MKVPLRLDEQEDHRLPKGRTAATATTVAVAVRRIGYAMWRYSLAEIRTKLDTQLKHLATKNELTTLKVWVLSGVLGGMAIAAGIAVAMIRFL